MCERSLRGDGRVRVLRTKDAVDLLGNMGLNREIAPNAVPSLLCFR